MADDADKLSNSAEKAYAAAAAAPPAKVERAKPVAAPKDAKPALPKVAKPTPTPTKPKKKLPPVATKPPPAPSTTQPTITQLKEKIMATAKNPDFSKTITDAVSEMQAKAKPPKRPK